jgi:hypothetical protein
MIQITPQITAQNLDVLTRNEGILIAYSNEKAKWIYSNSESIAANPEKYPMYFSPTDVSVVKTQETQETQEIPQVNKAIETAIDDLFDFIKTWSVRSEETDKSLSALKQDIMNAIPSNPTTAVNNLFEFITINAVRNPAVNQFLTNYKNKIMACI